MFIAYEATPITQETLGLIGSRMGSEADATRWAQTITDAVNASSLGQDRSAIRWIVFNCSPRTPFEINPSDHLIVTNQYLLDTFHVARSFEQLHWITPKK